VKPCLALLFLCGLLSACGTHVVEVDINNHLDSPIRNVEVTFGGGTYGRSSIAAGASHHNRIKIFNLAPIQVQFDDATGHHITISGPPLSKNAEGTITLTIDRTGAKWAGAAASR
jgi:hypothetical protein